MKLWLLIPGFPVNISTNQKLINSGGLFFCPNYNTKWRITRSAHGIQLFLQKSIPPAFPQIIFRYPADVLSHFYSAKIIFLPAVSTVQIPLQTLHERPFSDTRSIHPTSFWMCKRSSSGTSPSSSSSSSIESTFPSAFPFLIPSCRMVFASYSKTFPPITDVTSFLTFSCFAVIFSTTYRDISTIVHFTYSLISILLCFHHRYLVRNFTARCNDPDCQCIRRTALTL